MARTRAELETALEEFKGLADRLALRAAHEPTCDCLDPGYENACCTCGLEDLLSHHYAANQREVRK